MIKTNESVKVEVKDSGLWARLPCEIDHHSATRVRRTLDEAICAHRPHILYIDASGVEFMDSSGLGLLMGRLALMKKLQGELVLSCPSASVLRMVRMAGMERIIRIESNDKDHKG